MNGRLPPSTRHPLSDDDGAATCHARNSEAVQAYRTLAHAAGIWQLDIHLLMSHSLLGGNAGYIMRHGLLGDRLRKQMARVSLVILDAAGNEVDIAWLHRSQQEDAVAPAVLQAGD